MISNVFICQLLIVFQLSLICIVFVGYLTHSDYYDKISTNVGEFVFYNKCSVIMGFPILLAILTDTKFSVDVLWMAFGNSFLFILILLLAYLVSSGKLFEPIRNYYGRKRNKI